MNQALVPAGSDTPRDRLTPERTSHAIPGKLKVGELLKSGLTIPAYQRPYKWTIRHLTQLFADLVTFKDTPVYRLGTIVFHGQPGGTLDIVDGQQRTITLILIVRALLDSPPREDEPERRPDLQRQLLALSGAMPDPVFTSEESKTNLRANYLAIQRTVSRADFTDELIDFLLNRCEVVTFTLTDVSEAFQFFDSQNARGRDLEPHDLLKAYHLREFGQSTEAVKAGTVARWEASRTEELASLFAEYLYRVRRWINGDSARRFGKEDTALFKGVNLENTASYPWLQPLRIAHHFVDHYNVQYERQVDGQRMSFPFQLDQTIINGRRFFESVTRYQQQVERLQTFTDGASLFGGETGTATPTLTGYAGRIIEAINNYPGMYRTGDSYVRAMFDCLLLWYIDKFGSAEISRAIEKIFIWAWTLRLTSGRVGVPGMDKHVLGSNLFRRLREAARPSDFLNHTLRVVTEDEKQSTRTEKIEALFEAMKYYERRN